MGTRRITIRNISRGIRMKDEHTAIEKKIRKEMKWLLELLETQQQVPFVSHDKKEEKKWIKKMHKAAILIHNYYSIHENRL